MTKRNFDDTHSQNGIAEIEEEPDAKRQLITNFDSVPPVSPPNGNPMEVSSQTEKAFPTLKEKLEEKSVDKSQFFENVLDYFNVPNPVLDSDDNACTPSLPQMLLNPKAVKKQQIMLEDDKSVVSSLTESHASSGPKCEPNAGNPVQKSMPGLISLSEYSLGNSTKVGMDVKAFPDAELANMPVKSKGAGKIQKQPCCIVDKLRRRFVESSDPQPLTKAQVFCSLRSGRPQPLIPTLGVAYKLYTHHDWITGCSTVRKLFCWPCLIFTPKLLKTQNSVWVREGFDVMVMLGTSMTKHAMSMGHVEAVNVMNQVRKMSSAVRVTDGKVTEIVDMKDMFDTARKCVSGKDTNDADVVTARPKVSFKVGQQLDIAVSLNHTVQNNIIHTPASSEPTLIPTTNIQAVDAPEVPTTKPQAAAAPVVPTSNFSTQSVSPPAIAETSALNSSPGLLEFPDYSNQKILPQTHDRVNHHFSNKSWPTSSKSTTRNSVSKVRSESSTDLQTDEKPSQMEIPIMNYSPTEVKELLKNNFVHGTWTEEQREQIIAAGRPMPDMVNMSQQLLGVTRYFSKTKYDQFPWLCGSLWHNRLFCWPCLLFNKQSNITWNSSGYATVLDLSNAASAHSSSQYHLEASIRLKIYERIVNKKYEPVRITRNQQKEMVRQKRDLLKYLIEAICFKKKQSNNTDVLPEDIQNFLNTVCAYDKKLKNYLGPESSPNFMKDFTPNFVYNYFLDVVSSTQAILRRRITKEVTDAVYVSLILKSVRFSAVALIVRYATSSAVIHERFFKLMNIRFGEPEVLLQEISAVIGDLDCAEKFVGISYDGGVLKPDQMELFNKTILEKFEAAHFFHYPDENLKMLIQQSLSNLGHCRSFFFMVRELGKFLQDNPRVLHFVRKIGNDINGKENSEEWDLSSGFIGTLHDNYQAIMKFLDQVTNRALAPHAWTNRVISQCTQFSMFFGLLETRFFLVLLSKIFVVLHPLIEAMQGPFHLKYWKNVSKETFSSVLDIRMHSFGEVYRAAVKITGFDSGQVEDRTRFMSMFNETIDWILNFIRWRTNEVRVWAYFDVSTNITDSPIATAKQKAELVTPLREIFPFFDAQKLASALLFTYHHVHFQKKSSAEILKSMIEWDLKPVLPDLYNFLLLIFTVPMSSELVSSPISERISAYVKDKTDLNSTDAILYIEKDLLTALQKGSTFFDDVIDLIAETRKTEEFTEIRDTNEVVSLSQAQSKSVEVVEIID